MRKQLNNIETGEIILIEQDDFTDDITYIRYENYFTVLLNIAKERLYIPYRLTRTLVPPVPMSSKDVDLLESQLLLLTLPEFSSFTLSDDIKNWKEDLMNLRIFIPRALITESMLLNSPLYTLVKKMEPIIRDLTVMTDTYFTCYYTSLEDMNPLDIEILNSYNLIKPQIKIDEKSSQS